MVPGSGQPRNRFGERLRQLREVEGLDHRRFAERLLNQGYPPGSAQTSPGTHPADWLARRAQTIEEADPTVDVPADVDVVELIDAADRAFPGVGPDLLWAFAHDELARYGWAGGS